MHIEELTFPRFLPFEQKDRTYQVLNFIEDAKEFEDNKGYVDKKSGKIYICFKDKKPLHNDVPKLDVTSGKPVIIDIFNPTTSKQFHIDNTYDLSMKKIVETSDINDVLYDEEAMEDMCAATSFFVPTINQDDDPLKKLIKQTIIDKKIDTNRLKSKMPTRYGLTNMKSALIGKTKMSIVNFNIWCELLGIDYEIIITDNGTDTIDPLKGAIHYTNYNNKITETKK